MTIRKYAATFVVLTMFSTPISMAQDGAETVPANDAATEIVAKAATSEIKGLTDIVLRGHVENLIEHNYWNATELYFSQRQDIDLTRAQFDELREEMRVDVSSTYDEVMFPIHNLMSALFNSSEAAELTKTIGEEGVQGALQTPLGQRFAGQAMPVIDQTMNELIFDQVYIRLPIYREAAIDKSIALGFLSADVAGERDAEFDMSIPEAEPASE